MPPVPFQADPEQIRRAFDLAMDSGVRPAIFTRDLFETGHDEANRAAVKARTRPELELVCFALRAPRAVVDRIVKGLTLHA